MDYSDDCCMDRFTPMQAEKMKYSWKLFREDYYYYAGNVDNSTVPVSTTNASTDTAGNSSSTTAISNSSSVSSSGGAGLRTHFGFFTAAFLVAILMGSI